MLLGKKLKSSNMLFDYYLIIIWVLALLLLGQNQTMSQEKFNQQLDIMINKKFCCS